jgi:succinoglycan biosynthesis transport protein ExoP
MTNLESLTINDYLTIFRRRIWYVVVVTILVTAGTVVYVKTLPAIYRSETTIAMSSRLVPEDYIRSLDRQTNNDQMEFVRQQLQSRTFLQGIIQEFHLAEPGPEGFSDGALFGIGKRIEILPITTTTFKLAFTATDRVLAQKVTKRLTERVIQLNDSFRTERVQTADQFLDEQLRDAANALSTAEQKVLQFKNEAFPGVAGETVNTDNLRDLQIQLAAVETKLEEANSQRKSLAQRLKEHGQLKLAIKSPTPARPAVADSHATTPAAAPPTALEIQLAQKQADLAAASTRYTALHPRVTALQTQVQQLEAQVAAQSKPVQAVSPSPAADAQKELPPLPEFAAIDLVPAEIQAELDQISRDVPKLESEKAALASKVASYRALLNPLPTVSQELAELSREYDRAKQRYAYLSDKRLNSEMAVRVDSSDDNELFRVIDPANLPLQAAGPNRRMFAMMGGVAGILMGLGIAFLRDFMDSTLHSEEHATAELNLPILAAIPSIPDEPKTNAEKRVPMRVILTQAGSEDPESFALWQVDSKIRNVVLNPLCFEAEHYRLLQTRLLAMQRNRPLKSILISSANPNEGKTFSSCCIAGILAQETGKKVLLIDADLRKASATRMLGLTHKSGKTFNAVMAGEADFHESILLCPELNLHFLPADLKAFNPAKVMSSHQLERILSQATEAFDWVIIDSPPILAVADANRMFPYCDGMMLVVHSGKTPMKLITDSIKRVGRDRILGVLMNQVKTVQSSYYYGGSYQTVDRPSLKTKRRTTAKLTEGD